MKLGKRLQAVLDVIDEGSSVCDVGCDHGKLCVQGLVTGKLSRALCIDISEKSLDKARKLAEEYGVENISFCVSDGLTAEELNSRLTERCDVDGLTAEELSELADTLVIAGIGGYNIIDILEGSKYTFSKYIFVPHQDSTKLREYLMKKYEIISDICVQERKFYDIIVCREGVSHLTPIEIEHGKNEVSGDFHKKLLFLKEKYIRIDNEAVRDKLDTVLKLLGEKDRLDTVMELLGEE